MAFISLELVAGLVAVILLVAVVLNRPRKDGLPLPPGPPKRPLVGNIPDMPEKEAFLAFDKWKKEYGDVVHLQLGGQDMILLNTHETALDLLERRSATYSDRPPFIMINEFAGFDWSPSTMRYGPVWRQHRTLLHHRFRQEACKAYESAQNQHICDLLSQLLLDPINPFKHIKHAIGALIMDIAYGIEVQRENDPWLKLADDTVAIFTRVTVPGAFLVDSIPLLRYVPEWMPGAGWKRQARVWKKTAVELADAPFAYVQEKIASGTFKPCIVSDLLADHPKPEDAQAVRNVGAIIYAAGADTTAAILHIFLLAMVLHPDSQKMAQEELDTVLGGQRRLPVLADRSQLPYMVALLKEVHRWHPVQPLNGPHVCTQEDEYRGYRIPKGSSVISNNWSMARETLVYGPDVDSFKPERFLGSNPPRDMAAIFGYGRRGCPGRLFAEDTVFLAASRLLFLFDIVPPADGSPVKARFKDGLFSPPEDFDCSVRVRTPEAQSLLAKSV